jgi:sensor domain CHASE-containing protein
MKMQIELVVDGQLMQSVSLFVVVDLPVHLSCSRIPTSTEPSPSKATAPALVQVEDSSFARPF